MNLHSAKDFTYVSSNKRHILKIAEYCKSNHIRLVIVTTPTWKTYNNRLNPCQLAIMNGFIGQLAVQYGAIYSNYMQDSRFIETDFTDCNHMSCDGAEKLSKLLADVINE